MSHGESDDAELDERVPLTVEQALAVLDVQDGHVHTFLNPAPGVLVGVDWPVEQVRRCFEANGAELSGEEATAMRHGVAAFCSGGATVFFATKADALAQVAS